MIIIIIFVLTILVLKLGENVKSGNFKKQRASFQKYILSFFNSRLNSSVKRIGFILLIISVFVFAISHLRDNHYDFYRSISFQIDSYWFSKGIAFGFYGTLIGFLLSFAYDNFLGKIISWVKLKK